MGRDWIHYLSTNKIVGKMTREIKFRAWDDGVMIYSDNNWDGGNYSEYDYLHFFFQSIRGDAKVMQYTGLTDSNGKEIYEGDIIRCVKESRYRKWDNHWTDPVTSTLFGQVEYYRGYFLIRELGMIKLSSLPYLLERGDNINGEWEDKFTDFEVVGNVFDNPELIKTNP